ncbi:bacillithiol system protein YtxJ [Alkalibacillus flavidus]|uniref:Bacillithiol system protein YtxJ n=1 Tax=Alkalibacillus flavidus TaxID=546021 RepID=A0ABV2KTG6_9BACI
MTVKQLSAEEELNQLLSEDEAILLKHSLTCPISAQAKGHVEAFANKHDVPTYVIHIQENRDLSNEVSNQVGIKHESPQVLYLKQGDVQYHASHFDITEEQLNNVVTS